MLVVDGLIHRHERAIELGDYDSEDNYAAYYDDLFRYREVGLSGHGVNSNVVRGRDNALSAQLVHDGCARRPASPFCEAECPLHRAALVPRYAR